jgi:hypothetical protein
MFAGTNLVRELPEGGNLPSWILDRSPKDLEILALFHLVTIILIKVPFSLSLNFGNHLFPYSGRV